MKRVDVVEGMEVTVSAHPHAKVYKVVKVMNFNAVLQYTDGGGKVCTAGTIDVSFLRRPTKNQLLNDAR